MKGGRSPLGVVELHDADPAGELDPAGQRSAERAEGLAILVIDDAQVLACRALLLGAVIESRAVVEADSPEVRVEVRRSCLGRLAIDPDRPLRTRLGVVYSLD